MGWYAEGNSASERAARQYGANQDRRNKQINERDDKLYLQRRWEQYHRENWEHKKYVCQAEQSMAHSQGRPPAYFSPAQVPDMPVPQELLEPEPEPPREWPSWAKKAAIACLFLFVVLPIVVSFVKPLGVILDAAIILLFWGVVLLFVVWLVLRLTAGQDPERLARAEKINPVRLAKAIFASVNERKERRRERNAAAQEQQQQR